MGHAAITDKRDGLHRFSEVLYREIPLLARFGIWPEPTIARSRGPAGTDADWELRWNGSGFDITMRDDAQQMALELSTQPLRPMVYQGPGGLSRKSDAPGAASLYYSFTRLETNGRLTIDGREFVVRGVSWMDVERSSNQLTERQVGWDWFGLRLDDGSDLMLYELRDSGGGVDYGSATRVAADGTVRYLGREAWRLRSTERWTSPGSGIDYPARWTIELPSEGIVWTIEPDVAGQENVSRAGLSYWEGAVTVRDRDGGRVGEGYVELTGYGEGNRPPI
jgi:predicted secreted hydrolase